MEMSSWQLDNETRFWAGDVSLDLMRNQRNEYRYKRQEDPRAESYGITTFRD